MLQGRISSAEDEVAWYLKTVLDQYVPNVNPHIRQVISKTWTYLDKSVYLKIIFLFLDQNVCCGFSKRRFFWAPKTNVKTDG